MAGAMEYITQFDSTTSMLYALGSSLHDKGFKGAGVVPSGLSFALTVLNRLPFPARQFIYRWSGDKCALRPEKLSEVRAEEISEWVVRQYPEKRYPVVFIGSSNGAAVHLAAALQAPWLPQTYLVAVRRTVDPDELEADIEWGRKHAPIVRKNNPELRMQQMHDPVQDRLMVAKMAYFRVKRLRLGETFERFLRQRLEPNGTIILLEDGLQWPMIQVAEEHTFQVGGLGALEPQEYLKGSERIERFLRAHGSTRKSWPLGGNTFLGPESEWGFAAALGDDVERFAKEEGFQVRRMRYRGPEALSPVIADLYRWWHAQRGVESRKLLVECFALLEPWLTLKAGLVPFWMAFNTEPSCEAVESYLRHVPGWEDIYLILMSNGIEGVGQVDIERWRGVIKKASRCGEFLGVDEQKYPLDFESFVRYHQQLKKKAPLPEGSPEAMSLADVDRFFQGYPETHGLEQAVKCF